MLKLIDAKDIKEIQKRLLARAKTDYTAQQKVVDEILSAVREKGDEALFAYVQKFDGYDIKARSILVSDKETEEAFAVVDKALLAIVEEAANNIKKFHDHQKRQDWWIEEDGKRLGQLYLPIERAGVYVPGGKAAYPSSVLMNIIPAKCAGVGEIIVATPATGGQVNPVTIAAAKIAGADKIYKMGGAQAVAAMAYGTKSVPKVDKITGPGNVYVALAKKSVFGIVGIDMIAGPSEVLVIADSMANPEYVAADILSQAEHDEMAAGILVTNSLEMAREVNRQIEIQLEGLDRKTIAQKSIENYGTCIIVKDLKEAAEISNIIAPEHLEICTKDPEKLLGDIRNAGSIFLGNYSPEPLGDYFAGANHILPTNGTARFSSPLNVDDFQKKSSVLYYTEDALRKVSGKVSAFAMAEGLQAHAKSASIRFEK